MMQQQCTSSHARCGAISERRTRSSQVSTRFTSFRQAILENKSNHTRRAYGGRHQKVHASCSQQQHFSITANFQEEVYDLLAERVLKNSQPPTRHFVGIAGVPGSGKSTAAREVCRRINKRLAKGGGPSNSAIAIPMDGFHYYKRELDAMEDPAAMHARRGAHWTFNAAAFVAAMRKVREGGAVRLPSFAHGVGDPVEDDIQVEEHHAIVLVEGNYLLIDVEPWDQLASLFDDTWYVDCDVDTAMQRVYDRQINDNKRSPEVVAGRISGNDRPNAEFIEQFRHRAQVIVPSIPFKAATVVEE